MQPLISVIVPVYNVEPYLRRCIDSILAQTYENLEIILVDDGSTDNSPAICDEYAHKDIRIHVAHKKNGGASDARNTGLQVAKGDWIGFVDSDDYINKDMYTCMYEEAIRKCADIVCCGRYIEQTDGEKTEKQCNHLTCVLTPEEAIGELLLSNIIDEAPWDKIYKKHLFENLRFPMGQINEDIVVLPEIFGRSRLIGYIGEPLYHYRMVSDSCSRSAYSEKYHIVIPHMSFIDHFIDELYPNLKDSNACFQVRYANSMLSRILLTCNKEDKMKFRADYLYYRGTLKKYFWTAVRNKRFFWKHKAKGLCIILGIYKPIVRIRAMFR